MDIISIGRRVKELRQAKGIKQETFAEMSDLSATYISAIERGVKTPALDSFIRIANALGVSSDALLEDGLSVRNEIVTSQLASQISVLPLKEQERILNVVAVMIKDALE